MDGKRIGYLHSSTFWVLAIGGSILWALVIYFCLNSQHFLPGVR